MTELSVNQLVAIARQHADARRLDLAQDLCHRALLLEPDHVGALLLQTHLAEISEDIPSALTHLKRALSLSPEHAELLGTLARITWRRNRQEDARHIFAHALRIDPNSHDVLRDFAEVLIHDQRFSELNSLAKTMQQSRPASADAQSLLALYFYHIKDFTTAAQHAAKALELIADTYWALVVRGDIAANQGFYSRALDYFQRALAVRPSDSQTLIKCASALLDSGFAEESAEMFRKALEKNPQDARLLEAAGKINRDSAASRHAVVFFQKALEKDPDNANHLFDLAIACKKTRDIDTSLQCYQRLLTLEPESATALHNMGLALKNTGDLDGAIDCFKKALATGKLDFESFSSLVYTAHFHPGYGISEIRELHAQWNQSIAEPLSSLIQPHHCARDPEKRLKIGYISPHFSTHPVGRFMLALSQAHDHHAFDIHYYSDRPSLDDLGHAIQSAADHWADVADLSDSALAERIRHDHIDILIDLNMHMAHSRMRMFARKPAPVQMTYLAYCSTTGLRTMDYRISDPWLDPPEWGDSLFTERTLRLPRTYWCYAAPAGNISVNPLPAISNGYVTFASLNNFCKLTPATLELWARLLAQVPNSRLLMHSWPGSARARVESVFARFGVAADRLGFFDRLSLPHFFQLHHAIDIALDPFPYPGGTTTCDSLWMGVPTLSLVGDAPWKRAGLSIMRNMNLPGLATDSEESYLHAAIDLASDLSRLAELRQTLRQRFIESPLMDGKAFALDMESLYRTAWRTWCHSDQ